MCGRITFFFKSWCLEFFFLSMQAVSSMCSLSQRQCSVPVITSALWLPRGSMITYRLSGTDLSCASRPTRQMTILSCFLLFVWQRSFLCHHFPQYVPAWRIIPTAWKLLWVTSLTLKTSQDIHTPKSIFSWIASKEVDIEKMYRSSACLGGSMVRNWVVLNGTSPWNRRLFHGKDREEKCFFSYLRHFFQTFI